MSPTKGPQSEPEKTTPDYQKIVIRVTLGFLIAIFLIIFAILVFRFVPITTSMVASTYSSIFGESNKDDSVILTTEIPETSEPTQNDDEINVVITPATSTKPAQTTTVTPKIVTYRPDLNVRIISVGIVDRYTNTFVYGTRTNSEDRVGVQFEISNIGNVNSGNWSFNAILPINTPNNVYTSPIQSGISPGGRVLFTISFKDFRSGYNTVTIHVDPLRLVQETNITNNIATTNITSYTGYNSRNIYRNDGPDLDISLIAIGRMDGNRFVKTNNLDVNDEIAVKFLVENIGDEDSDDDWRFEAELDGPRSSDDDDYRSPKQDSIDSGDSEEFIVSFDNLKRSGVYDVTIEIDPDRDLDETYRGNNTLRVSIDVDN